MKRIIFFVFIGSVLAGCGKKDDMALQQPQPTPDSAHAAPVRETKNEWPTVKILPPPAQAAIRSTDPAKLRTHALAAKVYLNMPDSALMLPPTPPGMRPFRNLKLVEANDSLARYTFSTARGTSGDMHLLRTFEGHDTIWIPVLIQPH